MNLILDNTKEVIDFLHENCIFEEYHSNGKLIPDRIVVNGSVYRKISRSGFPYTANAIDYTGKFNVVKALF